MPQSGWQPHFSVPQSAPGPLQHVGHVGNHARRRERKPVAQRLGGAGLRFDVVRQMRQRVAARQAVGVADVFVAPGKRHRLKRDEADLVAVLERKLDDRSNLIVVDAVDDRDDQAHVDARGMQVLDRAQLDVEQIADLAVRIGLFADAVELQVRDAQAGVTRLVCERGILREANAVGRRLHAEVTHRARVADRIQEDRRDRRLAA